MPANKRAIEENNSNQLMPHKRLRPRNTKYKNNTSNSTAGKYQRTCLSPYENSLSNLKHFPTFKSRCIEPKHCTNRLPSLYGRSILNSLSQKSNGVYPNDISKHILNQNKKSPVLSLIESLQVYRTASPFDRRVTALEWHPTNDNVIAVGSKGGELFLWDIENVGNDKFIPGKGPGGSIQAFKFWPHNYNQVLTAAVDGTIAIQDFEGKDNRILLNLDFQHEIWYCSTDVNTKNNLIIAGDNKGYMTLLTKDGQQVMKKKLHKKKVTHVEFSPREPWLLCSSSVDHTVKLWDVRMLKDAANTLHTLQHKTGVDSAYFSLTDGCRLLTTDQNSELNVFAAPNFHLERTILHPHRQFQHITQIRAQWHPLVDYIAVGRYPDPKFPGYTEQEPRTIDIFDSDTGDIAFQLRDSKAAPGIVSLCKFNHMGDKLACGMGLHTLIWARSEEVTCKQEAILTAMKQQGMNPDRSNVRTRQGNTRRNYKDKKTNSNTKTSKLKDSK